MGIRRYLAALAVLFAVLPAADGHARRGQARIDEVQVNRDPDGMLRVHFRVVEALDPRVREALESGIPVRFRYRLRIERKRRFGRDEVVVRRQIERVLEKDNLKNRYRVSPGRDGETAEYASAEEAVRAMTVVTREPLVAIGALPRGEPLILRLKAELQKFKLPFHLHYVFAFLSVLDVETEWLEVELPSGLWGQP